MCRPAVARASGTMAATPSWRQLTAGAAGRPSAHLAEANVAQHELLRLDGHQRSGHREPVNTVAAACERLPPPPYGLQP